MLAATLLAGASGCGGASSDTKTDQVATAASATDDPSDAKDGQESARDEEARRQAALARLHARQEGVCEQAGDVLFTCALEDARASMSREELEKLDAKQLEPRYKADFMSHCMDSDMSLRQVKVFEGCLQQDLACAQFVSCLDAAQPQPQP